MNCASQAFVAALPLTSARSAFQSPLLRARGARASPLRASHHSSRRVRLCANAGAGGDESSGGSSVGSGGSSGGSNGGSSDELPAETREPPFEIRGFSLANVFLGAGALVTVSSFWSYIGSYGTASATSLGFVYGVPILLVGCALKYAELQPVEVRTSAEATAARTRRSTSVQRKIYQDITRHRYGDEAHLAAALSSLGLVPRGEPCPVLRSAEERVGRDGGYCLRLIFFSVATPYSEWSQRVERFERFFGPDVRASVEKEDAEQRLVALTLCCTREQTAAAA